VLPLADVTATILDHQFFGRQGRLEWVHFNPQNVMIEFGVVEMATVRALLVVVELDGGLDPANITRADLLADHPGHDTHERDNKKCQYHGWLPLPSPSPDWLPTPGASNVIHRRNISSFSRTRASFSSNW
jgi:hypothetical protein